MCVYINYILYLNIKDKQTKFSGSDCVNQVKTAQVYLSLFFNFKIQRKHYFQEGNTLNGKMNEQMNKKQLARV